MTTVSTSPVTAEEINMFGPTITVITFERDGHTIRIPVPEGISEYCENGESVGLNFIFGGHYE